MLPSSNSVNANETIEERLDAMPMEDFEVLLQQACQTNQQPVPEQHAEIIKQLKGSREGVGDNATLSNAKYHSSLQSLNNNEAPSHSHSHSTAPPHQNNHHYHPPTQESKGHHYGHHHYGHLNHTSTLTTINSTSSLNSVGVDGADGPTSHSLPHTKHPFAYFFNDRDNVGGKLDMLTGQGTVGTTSSGGGGGSRISSIVIPTATAIGAQSSHSVTTMSKSGVKPGVIIPIFARKNPFLPTIVGGQWIWKRGIRSSKSKPKEVVRRGPPVPGGLAEDLEKEMIDKEGFFSLDPEEFFGRVKDDLLTNLDPGGCLDRGPSLQGSVRREFPGHLLPSSTTTGGVGPDNAMSGEWSTFVPGSNGDVAAVPMSPDGKSDTASTRTQSVTTRITKKKINKTNAKEVSIILDSSMPGFRGNDTVESLIHFVEGTEETLAAAASGTKKKPGKKDKGGAKTKETLVKSASLDENHLNTRRSRSSSSSTERTTSKSLKEVEKKSEKAVSSHQIQMSSSTQVGSQNSQPGPEPAAVAVPSKKINNNTAAFKPNNNKQSSQAPPPSKENVSARRKAVEAKRPFRPREDDSPAGTERPFELVTKKKKNQNKKSVTQREAESFSRGQAKEASRREQARSRRGMGGMKAGERRTSVCSAPGSENSDQSDDDSVRSLPAGECTPREHVPKQCTSSGGTPQTSYADIAKVPEPRKIVKGPPPAPSPSQASSSWSRVESSSSETPAHPIVDEANFPSMTTIAKTAPPPASLTHHSNTSKGRVEASAPIPAPVKETILEGKDCLVEAKPVATVTTVSTASSTTSPIIVHTPPSTASGQRVARGVQSSTSISIGTMPPPTLPVTSSSVGSGPVFKLPPVRSTPTPPVEPNLVNGDYDQGEEGEEGRRSRKSASVSSSVSVSGSEAVVFCRGNVETEIIPNQDVGVEFGFNVLENTTYLAWPPQPLEDAAATPETIEPPPPETSSATIVNPPWTGGQGGGGRSHHQPSSAPYVPPASTYQNSGYHHQGPNYSYGSHQRSQDHTGRPGPSQQEEEDDAGLEEEGGGDSWSGQFSPPTNTSHYSQYSSNSYHENTKAPRYRAPPPSLLGNYRGMSDRRPSHPPYTGRDNRERGGRGGYRGRNGGDRGDRNNHQGNGQGSHVPQQQQQSPLNIMTQQQQVPQYSGMSMPIQTLPSPTGCLPPNQQTHYGSGGASSQPQQQMTPAQWSAMMSAAAANATYGFGVGGTYGHGQGNVNSHHHRMFHNMPTLASHAPHPNPPVHHQYMSTTNLPPMVGMGSTGGGLHMPIYAYPSQLPASGGSVGDENMNMSQIPQHLQLQPQMPGQLTSGANMNMTMSSMPMPLMMPQSHYVPMTMDVTGSGGGAVPPPPPATTTYNNNPVLMPGTNFNPIPPPTTRPYIGQVEYDDDGQIVMPPGVEDPYLYYPPPDYEVPTPASEVEAWMNSNADRLYAMEAAGKITIHRV